MSVDVKAIIKRLKKGSAQNRLVADVLEEMMCCGNCGHFSDDKCPNCGAGNSVCACWEFDKED